jgi:hypothetical protein
MLAHGGGCGHILCEFMPPLGSLAILEHAHPPGWDIRRVQANDASVADFSVCPYVSH